MSICKNLVAGAEVDYGHLNLTAGSEGGTVTLDLCAVAGAEVDHGHLYPQTLADARREGL